MKKGKKAKKNPMSFHVKKRMHGVIKNRRRLKKKNK